MSVRYERLSRNEVALDWLGAQLAERRKMRFRAGIVCRAEWRDGSCLLGEVVPTFGHLFFDGLPDDLAACSDCFGLSECMAGGCQRRAQGDTRARCNGPDAFIVADAPSAALGFAPMPWDGVVDFGVGVDLAKPRADTTALTVASPEHGPSRASAGDPLNSATSAKNVTNNYNAVILAIYVLDAVEDMPFAHGDDRALAVADALRKAWRVYTAKAGPSASRAARLNALACEQLIGDPFSARRAALAGLAASEVLAENPLNEAWLKLQIQNARDEFASLASPEHGPSRENAGDPLNSATSAIKMEGAS